MSVKFDVRHRLTYESVASNGCITGNKHFLFKQKEMSIIGTFHTRFWVENVRIIFPSIFVNKRKL